MPYDALGNYIPGDDEPSLDQMRLELTQSPQASRPLDTATQKLKQVATDFNPLMLMKSIREGVGSTMVNPVVAGVQGIGSELKSPEFYDTSRTKPTGIAEKVATDFMQRNAPSTPLAQEFTESLGKLTQDLPAYLGHLPTNRPVLTPNDVRVMGAEATRLGRQVRDIPTDFANAQAGVQRLDPVTGQPTMGTKLQAGAESIGDLMARRREQGLSPVPGVPETFTPETSMYAIRPSGSRIALPVTPPTRARADMPRNAAPFMILEEIVPEDRKELDPTEVRRIYENIRIERNIPSDSFNQFITAAAVKMYPDAPTPGDALEAFKERFSTTLGEASAQLEILEDFLNTPEGQASPLAQLPKPSELQARHKAASEWLYGPWLNYINKHVGTSGDPALKLASQGLTYLPREDIAEQAYGDYDENELRAARRKANMPTESEIVPALTAKRESLEAAQVDLAQLQRVREAYRESALRQGLEDPGQLPEYAATSAPIRELTAQVEKLEEDIANLNLGRDFESLSDMAITPRSREEFLSQVAYPSHQFYPSVIRARPDDVIFNMGSMRRLTRLGLQEIAQDVYNGVMNGNIPIEKLKSLTIDKLIRQKAEPRIAEEKAALKAQATFVRDATAKMQQTMERNVPQENYFGNVGVIELTQKSGLTPEAMTQILSQATAVLDHCIAQGGDAGQRRPNPFHPKHKQHYLPIYDPATGQKNPKATRSVSAYANSIATNNDRIADIRDKETGVPIATLEFQSSHDVDGHRMYNINYASGLRNGEVDPKYRAAITEYLNSRADIIHSSGSNLERNLDIYDVNAFLRNRNAYGLLHAAGVPKSKQNIDLSGLPRFVTVDDVRNYANAVTPAAPTPAAPTPATRGVFNTAAVTLDLSSAIDNAIDAGFDTMNRGASDVVRNVLDQALPANQFSEITTPEDMQAFLRSAIDYLTEWADNSQLARSENIRDAGSVIADFLPDLEGINSAIERGVFTVTPEPAAAVPYFDAASYERFMLDIAQNVDATVAREVSSITSSTADALGFRDVGEALRQDPTTLAHNLADIADMTDNAITERTLRDLADLIAPPIRDLNEPLPELNFEPDETHQANQRPFNTQEMAFELFQDTRRGEGRDLDELRTTLQALDNGNFDDARIRALPADQQDRAQRDVAHQIRAIMDDLNITIPAEQQPQQQQVADFRPIADHASEMTFEQLRESLTPTEMAAVSAVHDNIVRDNPNPDEIRTIAQLVYDHQMGPWENFFETQRAMLYMELTFTATRMDDQNRGRAEGGPVRGYQDGGTVSKYPGFFGARDEALERSSELYGSHGQDDASDAARHMLASGYMAQSVGPTIAKGLGWLHEFKEAPLRTAGHALGISKPRYDYEMDMHNNALGIEMAQKAKDRAAFEEMVKASIAKGATTTTPGRARLMTPEQASEGRGRLKYANGGTLSQTPSLDAMKLELLMRSK